jgi:DNA-3-methyladenine glycosylase II
MQTRLLSDADVVETWPEAHQALTELDARLRLLIKHSPPCQIPIVERPFEALSLIVLYQQISGRAAQAIAARIRQAIPGALEDPCIMQDLMPSDLRPFGVPKARADTLRRVAAKVVAGELNLEGMSDLPDEEVRARLQAVPGLGPWSSGMFLLFHLGRPDVFLPGDIGIRKAMATLAGAPQVTAQQAEAMAQAWRPWRSAAMWVLWHSIPDFPSPGVR